MNIFNSVACFINKYDIYAIQICNLTAFGVLPKKLLICRFCFIHLKNNSICHLF